MPATIKSKIVVIGKGLEVEACSAEAESVPSEALRSSAKLLVREVARPSEPSRDLNREDCSTRPESILHEALRDLESAMFSAKPESKLTEPVRDLNSEACSTRPEATVSEALKLLPTPLP